MQFHPTQLPGFTLITPEVKADERGYFFRSFCKEEFTKAGLPEIEFVQLNHSFNKEKGTFRGLHFQFPPAAEDKLVRCVSGAIFDIAVDVRQGSPTFLQWQGFELSDQNHQMLFIPKGFAHGFITLTPNAALAYHHTAFYQPGHEGGLSVFDPRLSINLPAEIRVISERDQQHPYLSDDFTGITV